MTTYADAYDAQLQQTPSLDPNMYTVHTILGGTAYNAAGDILGTSDGYNIGDVYGSNTTSNTSTSSGTTSAYSAPSKPTVDANTVASLNDTITALQRLLTSSNVSKDQGLQSIDESYGNTVTAENTNEAGREGKYATQLQDNATAKDTGINQVNSGARTAYDALQRLLGIQGAGVSSASTRDVPYAVSRNATQRRTGVINTAGKNERDINTALEDVKRQHANVLTDLLSQKQDKTRTLLQGILQHQADINQQLATAVTQLGEAKGGSYTSTAGDRSQYTGAISNIQDALDNLFNQYRSPSYAPQTVNPTAVTLGKYTVDPIKIQQQAQNPNISADLLPYLALLKKDQTNPIGV